MIIRRVFMDFIYEDNKIYLNNESGNMIAEVTFPKEGKDTVNINHTFVDDTLRGKGIASMLMKACAEKLKRENKKATLTCSYAIKWFEQNEEYSDILV